MNKIVTIYLSKSRIIWSFSQQKNKINKNIVHLDKKKNHWKFVIELDIFQTLYFVFHYEWWWNACLFIFLFDWFAISWFFMFKENSVIMKISISDQDEEKKLYFYVNWNLVTGKTKKRKKNQYWHSNCYCCHCIYWWLIETWYQWTLWNLFEKKNYVSHTQSRKLLTCFYFRCGNTINWMNFVVVVECGCSGFFSFKLYAINKKETKK